MKKENVILVDQWEANEEEKLIFSREKGILQIPISIVGENLSINEFVLNSKKGYARKEFIKPLCQYLNYFEKFYDKDKILLMYYRDIKLKIDSESNYNINKFKEDIDKLLSSLLNSINEMNNDNIKEFKNQKEERTNLMKLSLMYKLIIPLVTHFMFVNVMATNNMANEFVYNIFNSISSKSILFTNELNMFKFLHDLCLKTISLPKYKMNQYLIGIDSLSIIMIILVFTVPKYNYNRDNINFTVSSIKRNLEYKIHLKTNK